MARGYDTLDSVDIPNDATLCDLYTWVVGLPMAQADLCGILATGTVHVSSSNVHTWGRHVQFHSHPELWAVRSAPAGRLGQPLELGEVRQIAVLVRESQRCTRAKVSLIKLWRINHQATGPASDQGRSALTYGAIGVGIHGVNLFEDFVTPSSEFYATHNTHSVLSSIATIHEEPVGAVGAIEASMTPRYILGGAIAGVMVPDASNARACEEYYTQAAWSAGIDNNNFAFSALVRSRGYSSNSVVAGNLLRAAEDVFEQCSFVGYLDMLADPFYEGALPDHAHQPNGIPLMLAIAVRIACNPTRWGLCAALPEDAYVAREVCSLIESAMQCVIATNEDGVSGTQTFSIDIVINRALDAMQSHLRELQSGKLDGRKGGVDHKKMLNMLKQTVHFFYCTGIALCQDVCGLPPRAPNGKSTASTAYGFAHHVADPVADAGAREARRMHLGRVAPTRLTVRTSSRAKRQVALISVLVAVDQWLRTRKYHGVVLAKTAQAPYSVLPQDLVPEADDATVEAATASALPLAARGSKKKKKKQQQLEAVLAERGKLRGANSQYCATQAVSSLFCDKKDPRLVACIDQLSGEAIDQACGCFADVLQWGGCAGIGRLFDVRSYLVSPKSVVRCCHCERFVHVVQSVALAPTRAYSKCPTCSHPRCLWCISHDLQATRTPDAPHIQLDECHFCFHLQNAEHKGARVA